LLNLCFIFAVGKKNGVRIDLKDKMS